MSDISDNYAFIDGQNLHRGAIEEGWTIDYRKFRVYLDEKYNVREAFYFIAYLDDKKSLYNHLTNEGYTLIHKPTTIINGEIKGNCDAELVLHCMIEYNNFNKAVIVTGDSDYYCLIKYLRENRKLRQLLIPNKNTVNKLLKEASGGMINLMNDLKVKIAV